MTGDTKSAFCVLSDFADRLDFSLTIHNERLLNIPDVVNSGVAFLGGIVEALLFKSSVTALPNDPCLIKKGPADIKDIALWGHMSHDRCYQFPYNERCWF